MDSLEVSRTPLDEVLRLLADRQRRLILQHLSHEYSNQSSLEMLVDHLVDNSPYGPTSRGSVLTQLHHKDLPALERHGVIEYDSRTGTVRYHPNDRIEALLECLPDG